MHLQAGALLKNGEYKIEKVLGQGGFGITYLAEQTSLGRKVALKEFFMEGLCNRDAATSHVSVPSVGSKKLVERFKQKFIKEARNIASLEHKHIVPIIDVFEENGTAYYVMKYFSGGSLSFNSAIPEDVALRYTNQLASALRFIHQKRMMHLDVKPSNILLDDEGNVVLIDFGLAKQYDNAGQQTSTTPVGISHGYAPIEQYRSGGVSAFSPATDIYSLGATLYKLLTGTVPPEAMDIVATGLPACPANVSAETWNAVKSAMQPAASSRPQSVDEFLSLLSENGTEGRRPEGLKSKVKTENGKNKEENDGETELNGNEKAASKREGENLFTHTASESSFDEVKVERKNEKEHSVGVVISNESEKSQKNKPGKSLWLILLLLLIAVAGAWFLFGGTGNGDAPKEKEPLAVEEEKAPAETRAAERRKKALVRDENELLCVACVDKNDKSILYFTGEEWKELPEDEKYNYPQLGVSIREDGHEFIIAASDCKGEYKFGGNGIDFEDVKNYESFDELDATFITTGYNDTRNIVKQTKGERDSEGILGAPAAEAAWKYEVNDHDPLQWYLPSYSELQMIKRHKKDINRFLEDYFPSFTPIADRYWSSTECSNKQSWFVHMYGGGSCNYGRSSSLRVRAVASAK